MPKAVEDCVRKLMKTVKPRRGQTKREAAWAICQAMHNKKKKKKRNTRKK